MCFASLAFQCAAQRESQNTQLTLTQSIVTVVTPSLLVGIAATGSRHTRSTLMKAHVRHKALIQTRRTCGCGRRVRDRPPFPRRGAGSDFCLILRLLLGAKLVVRLRILLGVRNNVALAPTVSRARAKSITYAPVRARAVSLNFTRARVSGDDVA